MRFAPPRRRSAGFGLMSIVVALAIAGILLTIAIPSMLDQVARGQIKEALALASVARKPVDLAWVAGLPLPADNAAAGLPPADRIVSNYVSGVAVQDGAIHLTLGNRIHGALAGRIVTLRPAVVPDTHVVPIAWVCGHAAAPDKMTLQGADRTDVDVRLLPFECKPGP
jgi:type IV pilus assembly protein PilA